MPHRTWIDQATPLPGSPGVRHLRVAPDSWRRVALDLAAGGGRLLALWADARPSPTMHAAFLDDTAALVCTLDLAPSEATYPGLSDIYPAASRMQRAAADVTGVHARDADTRPWLRHAAWSSDYIPLANPPASRTEPQRVADEYPFVRVSGDGVHEIPVGPVHAGIIEPGHFRFSVVGEKVLKLEERLGYVHKGIEQRFAAMKLAEGHRLAARVSGDSAVAYAWAYCQALEGITGTGVPARALWLRALALEGERIANHLGDLGALGNDAGFAFGLAQFSRLKETWLRAQHAALGQRYLLDYVVPGGVNRDPSAEALRVLVECAHLVGSTADKIRSIYDEHAGVRDRFVGAGAVAPELARQLGLIGLAGRASGQDFDLRVDLPCAPYGELATRKALRSEGDVAARVAVRFDELAESIRLVEAIVARLPAGACVADLDLAPAPVFGVGLVEGWRGPVMVALTAGADGTIRRCHPHDPSWQNWPVLEHAIIGNIVPDFPLINKSFNLSYSGHDL
ncbi:MAG TPA: Ni,Fe-hydrogenase III large subunit [Burkholderiaceae bacterium]|nr:Ni,Fe-hydrogenase III large subunit [Burkholderiaceae bacterium]